MLQSPGTFFIATGLVKTDPERIEVVVPEHGIVAWAAACFVSKA